MNKSISLGMCKTSRKPILSNFKQFVSDCNFVSDLIHTHPHNEELKHRLYDWLNEIWDI